MSDAPFTSSQGSAVMLLTVYRPLPRTSAVTSARNARLEPPPQQFVVASPSETPVTGLPLSRIVGTLYTPSQPPAGVCWPCVDRLLPDIAPSSVETALRSVKFS